MACDKQDTEAIGPRPEEDQARMIPSAPPPPSYEEVLREDAEKRLVPSPPYPDELKDSAAGKQPHAGPWKSQNLGELVDDNADPINRKKKRQRKAKKVKMAETSDHESSQVRRRVTCTSQEESSAAETDDEVDNSQFINIRMYEERRAKRVMGWLFWVLCPPLALLCNCMREAPRDREDPYDWTDDPLRPWNYDVYLGVYQDTDKTT